MKIAFCVGAPNSGGGERVQNMIVEELIRRGHLVCLYTWDLRWAEIEDNISASVHILSNAPRGFIGKTKAFKEFKRLLKNDKPDCLVVFSLALAEVVVLAAKSAGVPSVTSERVDPYYLPQSLLHRFLKKFTYRLASGVVFQTNEVMKYFSPKIQRKSVVIKNPIIDDNLPVSDIYNSRKEIVAVGRLSEEKNFELLINAFAEIADKIPEYSLKIYGDGHLYNKLEQMIISLSMKSRITLIGKVDKVVEHIVGADIYVLTSNHEGMPNSLIEGMAMGLASIATDVRSGGTRALIDDKENGILIPTNDKEELKKAILNLLENDDAKLRIKSNALKIRETNSKELIIPMWVDFISSKCQS